MTDSAQDGSDASCPLDLLLLGAFGPELAPLKAALAPAGDTMRGRIGSLSVQARTCGIGLSSASAFASLHLAATRPRAVLLLGTCGAYATPGVRDGAELAIGDVIVSRRIVLADWATLEGHAQFPPASAEPIASESGLRNGLVKAGARAADVANTLGITVKDDVAARIARHTGARVEHMETYGVATASAACAVPFAAVLGVANAVGATGRSEWREHHARASEAAARVVVRWIETLSAEGLAPRPS